MKRRHFLKQAGLAAASFAIAKDMFAHRNGPVYGHNSMRYTMNARWGTLNPAQYPVNDCHEMVQDKKGRIILLTNETRNNISSTTNRAGSNKAGGTSSPARTD